MSTPAQQSTAPMPCVVCGKGHALRHCSKFLRRSLEGRLRLVLLHRVCSNCLAQTHNRKNCPSAYRCRVCHEQHHTLLHEKVKPAFPQPSRLAGRLGFNNGRNNRNGPRSPAVQTRMLPQNRAPRSSPKELDRAGPSSSVASIAVQSGVLLRPTAVVKVVTKERVWFVRALLDPNSNRSILAGGCARRLRLPSLAIGDSRFATLNLRARMDLNVSFDHQVHIIEQMDIMTPRKDLDERITQAFTGIKLADNKFYKSAPVELILGADIYGKIMRPGVLEAQFGRPLAQLTIFGYVLSGIIHE